MLGFCLLEALSHLDSNIPALAEPGRVLAVLPNDIIQQLSLGSSQCHRLLGIDLREDIVHRHHLQKQIF